MAEIDIKNSGLNLARTSLPKAENKQSQTNDQKVAGAPNLNSTNFKFDRKRTLAPLSAKAPKNKLQQEQIYTSKKRIDIFTGKLYKENIIDKVVNWLASKLKQLEKYLLKTADVAIETPIITQIKKRKKTDKELSKESGLTAKSGDLEINLEQERVIKFDNEN